MTPKFLSVTAVAQKTGVTTPRLRTMLQAGEFPPPDAPIDLPYDAWRPETIEEWLSEPRCSYGSVYGGGRPPCWRPRTKNHDPYNLGMCDHHTEAARKILQRQFITRARRFDREHDHDRKKRKTA